ncbi:MAG TPA: EscU/YscU/HrcU family type III secretion system export apparatus switch protein [Polyangiaceae bacterium]|jgi:type III secretion protein U|nr:EscU/YscU/HrcU family type III secretion system export apparatus switch protein [Polyangiaceae bacterium]
MSSEKTEEPTARRLRKAREQGDVAVSSAATQTAALTAAVVLLPTALLLVCHDFSNEIASAIQGSAGDPRYWATRVLTLTLPLLGAAAFAALGAGAIQTGAQVSLARLTPKLDNLNPRAGLGRLFSLERLFSVLRALLSALIVTWLVVRLLARHAADLARSVGSPNQASALVALIGSHLLWSAVAVSTSLAALELLVVRRAWLRRNRMSKDEIKREHKESEGDPHIKQERRRAHQEMLNSASLLAVRDANVLIVNPTHLATALRYDREGDDAPLVLAQGEGSFALRLIDAARAYGVPIVRDIPVAHALKELALGEQIPEELYEAVAEILRSVWEHSALDESVR